ncbi:MAG: hypothetical protein L6Q97_12105 [Thermoanaerobaculia bacterium]|nr:hypothetical protein [Thermoanaerobaculia bacterium]
MKKCQLFLVSAGMLLFMLVAGAQSALAQGGTPANTAAPKAAVPVPVTPFCDEAIPKVKAQLQAQADANCKTAQSCVRCIERGSNTELYATLVVQPEKLSCKRLTNLQVAQSETARIPADIHFEVMQSVCTRSGVSLEVLLPDASARASDFTYEWTIDGKPAGRAATLECACGETASIKVTKKSTKQSLIKTMTLPAACQPDAKARQ